MKNFKLLKRVIILLLIVQTIPSIASSTSDWIFKRANSCLNPDNVNRVAANGECLAIQTYTSSIATKPNPTLIIFIHGDGIPGGGPSDYLKFQATKFSAPNILPIVLIRPGYYDHYSTGESHAFDCNGYPCDGYRENTVATLAAAIKQLQIFYQPKCTLLVGHSGGAMMSAVILGKYPKLANGAVLASMVGNVHQWANRHGWGTWPNSLTPSDWVTKIPKNRFVYIISGTADNNTFPDMTAQYAQQLKQQGIRTNLISVKGGDHNSVVLTNPTEFDRAIRNAITDCEKS